MRWILTLDHIRCVPCKSIKPLFHELAEKNRDIIFLTVDMNEASDVATAMKIVSVPTFQFYRKGVEIHEVIGADEDALRKGIDKCLAIVHHENPNQCSSFESSNLHYKISVDEDI